MNIIIALIVYGVLVYELVAGYAISRPGAQSNRVTRNEQPVKYWSYLAFQFAFATTVLLYGLGILG